MFRQPRHIGDAFRGGLGCFAGYAGGVVSVRRRGHRCCRRLRTHRRQARGHPAALGTGNGEWVGEPAQRPSRAQPDRQRRRRPCHLPPKAGCATAIRHRRAGELVAGNGAPTRLDSRTRGDRGRSDCQRDACHDPFHLSLPPVAGTPHQHAYPRAPHACLNDPLPDDGPVVRGAEVNTGRKNGNWDRSRERQLAARHAVAPGGRRHG